MTNKSIKKIKRIIYPIYTSSITSFAPNFSLSSICSQKGKGASSESNSEACAARQYGVVTKVDDSYRPITITWDSDPEPFAYTEDEIRVLKIATISSYRSKQTIVRFPATTIVETQNGETLKFNPDQLFTVSSIDGDAILIENENGIYQFERNNFPCLPFANIVQIEKKNIDRTKLDWSELRVKANCWLHNNNSHLILETVDRAWKNRKQLEWHDKIIKDFPNCSDRDLEKAWDLAVTNFIIDKTQESGLYGFNLGDKLLWHKDEQTNLFGTLTAIDPEREFPLTVIWDDGSCLDYSLPQIRGLEITQIDTIRLSDRVAYEISSDGKYYRACIGFRTKKLAQAWLIPIKKIVGRLSNLRDCRVNKDGLLLDLPWQYFTLKPKHKTINKRVENLKLIANLDLEKVPPKNKD